MREKRFAYAEKDQPDSNISPDSRVNSPSVPLVVGIGLTSALGRPVVPPGSSCAKAGIAETTKSIAKPKTRKKMVSIRRAIPIGPRFHGCGRSARRMKRVRLEASVVESPPLPKGTKKKPQGGHSIIHARNRQDQISRQFQNRSTPFYQASRERPGLNSNCIHTQIGRAHV